MYCSVCGANNADGSAVCAGCGSPLNKTLAEVNAQPQAAASPVYDQELAAIGKAMYDYCKVELDPKISKGGMIAFAVLGVLLLAAGIAMVLVPLMLIGAGVGLFGSLIVLGSGKMAVKNAQRLKNLFANDGEEFILREFASAQSFANDHFRMSGFYIFVKGKGIYRTVNIEKITRVTESTNFIPTGVRLDALMSDEQGTVNITLCRLHLGKSKNEANDLFNEIMSRKRFAYEQYSQNR